MVAPIRDVEVYVSYINMCIDERVCGRVKRNIHEVYHPLDEGDGSGDVKKENESER